MEIQQTLQILIEPDPDLLDTLSVFQQVKQQLSEPCFNQGKPLGQLDLHKAGYAQVVGQLNAQMTCSAIRAVAGAYASAKRNKRPAQKPFQFLKRDALFLVGKRGRDAGFRKDGSLSIWTTAGRKHIQYTVPKYFQPILAQAKEIDSIKVVERKGRLIGFVCITLEVPGPAGILPVGVDLNETNILVAVDPDGKDLFISGIPHRISNRKTRKKRGRLQSKLASKKAEDKDTRSVRRALKRLGCKQSNRTKTFCQTVGKELVQWCSKDAVLVMEDLRLPQRTKKQKRAVRTGIRRRLSQWAFSLLTTAIEANAAKRGILLAWVNPAHTSTHCSRCGLRGERKRHNFFCPSCGFRGHADLNAAVNIRNRYTALRGSGLPSISPEALATAEGKPSTIADRLSGGI